MESPNPHDDAQPLLPDVLTIDPADVPSAVLRRLIAEVQYKAENEASLEVKRVYDRIHNRHNRGM